MRRDWRRRFRGSPLRDKVHAKTGTLVYRSALNQSWIYLSKALAGYIDLRTPERPRDLLCFAILISNSVAADRRKGVDALFQAQEEILEAAAAHWKKRRSRSDEKPTASGAQAGGGS